MKKYRVGYTQGVYDMFHIGHLNLINKAKECCDYLIVGVNSDKLVESYKNKTPIINEAERRLIIGNLKSVDKAINVDTLDKKKLFEILSFDVIFIGDDWKGSERWRETEKDFEHLGIDIVYLPYTPDISSTILRDKKDNAIIDN